MRLPERIAVFSDVPFAAQELCAYLEQGTGRAPSLEEDGYPITVRAGMEGEEAYRIDVREDGIDITAGSVRGAVFGVYDFLETYLGCRFFADDCELVPDMRTADIPLGVREQKPSFAYREVYWRGALDGRFALKSRLNSARADIPPEWGGRTGFYNYSHTFDDLVPPAVYFAEHPEYFSLVDGKRLGVKTQLCLTNPEVLAICTEGVRRWMRENPDCTIFSVAQNDWYSPCTCETCRALDEWEGSHAGSMIWFVNQIADAVAEEFPQNFIHTFAYLYTRKAPRTVRPRPNVIVRLCSIEGCFSHPLDVCEYAVDDIDVEDTSARTFQKTEKGFARDLLEWSACCDQLYIWDYTTNFANYLQPFPNLQVMQPNLRLFRNRGVKGVFEQGNYALGKCSAFGALKVYLLSKLLWDVDADVQAHAAEFLAGYYGEASAGALEEYLALMQEAAEGGHMSLFDGAEAAYLGDDALREGERLLRLAVSRAREDAHRERLERELLSVRYMRLARLPLDTEGRDAMVDAFAADVRRLGITELFERRELEASFACMKKSLYAADRRAVPYSVYRL